MNEKIKQLYLSGPEQIKLVDAGIIGLIENKIVPKINEIVERLNRPTIANLMFGGEIQEPSPTSDATRLALEKAHAALCTGDKGLGQEAIEMIDSLELPKQHEDASDCCIKTETMCKNMDWEWSYCPKCGKKLQRL